MQLGRSSAFATLLAAVLLAVACGGGGDDGGAQKDSDQQLLQAMVLAAGDLPQGLQQASVSVSTNKDIADASLDSEGTLAKLEARGRRLGYDVQFEPAQDAPSTLPVQGLQSTASIYGAAGGASEALAEGVAGARATDWQTIYSDETEVQVVEVPLPDGVDEGTWFRISGTDANGNLIIDDQIAFRVDTVRGFLRVLTAFVDGKDRDAYRDQVSQWVSTIAARMRDVLQHGAPAISPSA